MHIRNFFLLVILSLGLLPVTGCADENRAIFVRMRGVLTGKESEPCVVNRDSAAQQVKFDSIPTYSFYKQPRSKAKKFNIVLEKCDLTMGKTVTISFTGISDKEQPGLLAISGGETKGFAIALETEQGKPLNINATGERFILQNDKTSLNLQAYLQAAKKNVEQRTIQGGEFSAIATFHFDYN